MKIYKLDYMPGTTHAIHATISFRTNLGADICEKYLIEKTRTWGPSRHLKLR